uniref:Uncharacterized protein n=1 Tax=Arcella intermedia TaxID=1963864 RepID=A0A6B2LTS2_9EUKA
MPLPLGHCRARALQRPHDGVLPGLGLLRAGARRGLAPGVPGARALARAVHGEGLLLAAPALPRPRRGQQDGPPAPGPGGPAGPGLVQGQRGPALL